MGDVNSLMFLTPSSHDCDFLSICKDSQAEMLSQGVSGLIFSMEKWRVGHSSVCDKSSLGGVVMKVKAG